MQGRIAGFFMTIFMALPLAAIPLMSIFGIPQFGSLASSLEGTGFLPEDPQARSTRGEDAWDLNSAPVFGDSATSISPAGANPLATSQEMAMSEGIRRPAISVEPASSGGSSTSTLSWEQALRKLSDFGIREYRLQPNSSSSSYHIACFSKQVESRTVIRFEAEAADPLQAIRAVVTQVENWHRQSRVHQKPTSPPLL